MVFFFGGRLGFRCFPLFSVLGSFWEVIGERVGGGGKVLLSFLMSWSSPPKFP